MTRQATHKNTEKEREISKRERLRKNEREKERENVCRLQKEGRHIGGPKER